MHFNKGSYSKYSDSQEDDGTSTTNFDSDSSKNSFSFMKSRRLTKSADNTSCSGASYQSDSSLSDTKLIKSKQRGKSKNLRKNQLPPIGVFWDIENCQVPKSKSAASIVKRIREFFFDGYREAEFMIVCDVKKESSEVIQDLHDAQVNLIHVSSTSKNAADEKLRQSLRRFAEIFPPPSTVVLISSDINFASDLSDLRYRKKLHVILVHKSNVADALMLCANETYHFSTLTDNLPPCKKAKVPFNSALELLITNLPLNFDKRKIRTRLKLLSNNCGGKVTKVDNKLGTATIRFTSEDFLNRAQKRLRGEDVYGHKINVTNPSAVANNSSCKTVTGKKMKSSDFFQMPSHSSSNGSSQSYSLLDAGCYFGDNSSSRDCWSLPSNQDGHLQDAAARPIKGAGNMLSRGGHERRCRTPQDGFLFALPQPQPHPVSKHSSSDIEDSSGSHYQEAGSNYSKSSDGIDLIIANLDSTIDVKDIKSILLNLIKQYVMIVSLSVIMQSDLNVVAYVRVKNQQDAQSVISQLHHYKLGYKRINVSYVQINMLAKEQLKDMVIALLQEAPGKRMPLFKLLELLILRFHINVSIYEITKLKDVCKISEERTGRVISLMPAARLSPNTTMNRSMLLYCTLHCSQESQSKGWSDLESYQLPNVIMSLKLFEEKVNELLFSHMGNLPLLSLPICYECQFGSALPVNESGVPLEHLVTCLANVELKSTGPNKNIKYLTRGTGAEKKAEIDAESANKTCSPAISLNLQMFCREIVDLLKASQRCLLQFDRFIPTYHHQFGRQCRVADYGYTKLIDLLESPTVANFIQIMGESGRKTITLTHGTQMRRFTTDLLKMLKSQASKQILSSEFSVIYERTFLKPFNAVDYGLCDLDDLLESLLENAISVDRTVYPYEISIPKKERTPEEVLRTKKFAEDVVKLLCHCFQYSMPFNKFIPAFHHHFGYQCKLADYGFSKLIELFEAIPDTVRIEELANGERLVRLTQQRALEVLGNQLVDLIKRHELGSLAIEALRSSYLREYAVPLKLETYEFDSLEELLTELRDYVLIVETLAGPMLVLTENELQLTTSIRIWSLLIEAPHSTPLSSFSERFQMAFLHRASTMKLQEYSNVVEIVKDNGEATVHLTPFYVLAAQIYKVLLDSGGQIFYANLDCKYQSIFKKNINPTEFGFENMIELLNALNFVVVIKANWKKLTLELNKRLSEYGLPIEQTKPVEKSNGKQLMWPPPPVHNMSMNVYLPPKPDTPGHASSSLWSSAWSSPKHDLSEVNLHIELPKIGTPKFISNPNLLISPTSFFSTSMSNKAPDPAELPMPDKLLGKGLANDDSNDSGVANNSHVEMEYSNDRNGE